MHLINAVAWMSLGLCLVNSVGQDKLWGVALVCACLNVAWEFLKKKEVSAGGAVELKNLPRNKAGWEVVTDIRLGCWHSVIQSADKCLLVRSLQKLPRRFTTGEPVAVSIED